MARLANWKSLIVLAMAVAASGHRPRHASAMEHVTMERAGRTRELVGRIVVEGQDGSLLFQTLDGRMWVVEAEEVKQRRRDELPFKPLSKEEVGRRLLQELPRGFQIETTEHYVIAYNTSKAYARWCGNLWERLYRGFFNYWQTRRLELHAPEFPLVALIFDDRAGFDEYAKEELGAAVGAVIGYYNFRSNRVVTFDLTGIAQQNAARRHRFQPAQIRQLLAQPAAERNVATLIHEVTHQLAYNTGLQTRYAGNPFWVAEGLANFFETPDLRSSRGWRAIGKVNYFRLAEFRRHWSRPQEGRLIELIRDDRLFRNSKTAAAAYADAWALNYYLLKKKSKDYVAYLTELSKMKPLEEHTPEQRLAEFQRFFGDIGRIEQDLLKTMRRIR